MRKFVWVPVVSLGRNTQGQFLEIMSEPTCFGGINMEALQNCGLNKNIAATKTVLSGLPYQPSSAKLYLTGFMANLGNTQGINLALLLAGFIQAPTCPHQKIIVTGQLDTAKAALPVTTTSYFEAKANTILNLGTQPEALPFYFPRAMLTEKHTRLLAQLAAANIVLKPIGSLSEVLVDFGMPPIDERK